MNFYVDIFNTENERKYATLSVYYTLLFQERCKHNWNAKKICVVYAEGAVIDQTCQKWFAQFLGTTEILAK